MGCVSSTLLSNEDEFSQLGGAALGHHIVSLTSSTYGLLTLDPPTTTTPPTPPPRFTIGSIFPSPIPDSKSFRSDQKSLWSEPRPIRPEPEVINSWELMAGLDTTDSFRFPALSQHHQPHKFKDIFPNKENSNPNSAIRVRNTLNPQPAVVDCGIPSSLDRFETLCPPNGENRVVLYTTTLRGVRRTFEACNAVRAAIEGFGVALSERDISMDSGFREELRELMRGKEPSAILPPRVFIRGRYIGGAEEVMRIVEEGRLGELLDGLPRRKVGGVCEGCGDVRFLPCFRCNGSCKLVKGYEEDEEGGGFKQGVGAATVVVRCPDCNENGLVLCPICC